MTSNNKLEKKIAEEDIKCYVFLRDKNYKIPYNNVSINDELKLTITENNCYGGFNSYKYLEELELFLTYLGEKTNLTIKEAIIPKDSEYIVENKGYSFPVSKEHLVLTGFISNKIKIKE